jgi:hypothetical protein
MTRDEAVKTWITFGCHRVQAFQRRHWPQHIVDAVTFKNAEDVVDGMIALGVLKVDQPSPSPQESE